jgi:hypothetical protein
MRCFHFLQWSMLLEETMRETHQWSAIRGGCVWL